MRTPRAVPLTAARRRAIDSLFDRFVPSAVERRQPLRALALVTPAFRAGVSRTEWSQGKLPVFPYHARGDRFHGWTLNYSYARVISVDLMLRPGPEEPLGQVAFTAVIKRVGTRWLIDSFVPVASFAPQGKRPQIVAQPDLAPGLAPQGTKATLSRAWLLVLAGVLGSIVLIPIGLGIANGVQSRRAWRAYKQAR